MAAPELGNGVFRDAGCEDRSSFLGLWAEMLDEVRMYGGEFEAEPGTLGDVKVLFDGYVGGSMFGSCVLYEPPGLGVQGAGLCGEARGLPTIRALGFGRVAWGWGIYIRPEHREALVAFRLQVEMGRRLKALGFDTLVGDIVLGNEPGLKSAQAAGWEPHSLVHICRLKEWKHG